MKVTAGPVKSEYSLHRMVVELSFLEKLEATTWWQFIKRRKLVAWRESKLGEL
jgi:hypothetical protein